MSDRCRGWRLLLSRRADGDLTRYDREALDDHLGGCRDCRMAAQSDRTVHLALTRLPFALPPERARRIDDQVLLALGIPERVSPLERCRRRMRELWAAWEALPILYLAQIAGGTCAAAAITALFLLTTLHPIEDSAHAAREMRKLTALRAAPPPVPLEILLDRPSPRAAFLWVAPAGPRPGVAQAMFGSPAAPSGRSESIPSASLRE